MEEGVDKIGWSWRDGSNIQRCVKLPSYPLVFKKIRKKRLKIKWYWFHAFWYCPYLFGISGHLSLSTYYFPTSIYQLYKFFPTIAKFVASFILSKIKFKIGYCLVGC